MKILFAVDQRAAIEAGIDASSTIVHLDVSPAWLTSLERNVLSEILCNENDATQSGITWYEGEVVADPNGTKLRLTTPSIDGLRRAIAATVSKAMKRAETDLIRVHADMASGLQ